MSANTPSQPGPLHFHSSITFTHLVSAGEVVTTVVVSRAAGEARRVDAELQVCITVTVSHYSNLRLETTASRALTPNWGAAGVNGTQTHSGDRQLSSVHQSAEPHSGSLRARLVRLLPATARELVPTRAARRRRDETLQRTAMVS